MLHHLKAVVLRSVKYGESGIITQVFSDTYGRLSFLVHGVRKKKSKINPYLFQPLSLLDIVGYIKENREIQRIKEIKATFPLQQIHFNIRKSSIALFISEILNKTLREADSNQLLFDYLTHAIQVLDIAEKGVENFHLVFLIQYTKFIGIYPRDIKNLPELPELHSEVMPNLLEYSLSDISKINIDKNQRRKLLDAVLQYYKYHFEGIGAIKSIEVLREVFK